MSYIGVSNYPSLSRIESTQIATSGQTVFNNLNYNPAVIEVFVNGVKLAYNEFQASDGTSITILSPTVLGDVVNVVSDVDLADGDVLNVNGQTGSVNLTTSTIPEGVNLYYTAGRVVTDAPVRSVAGMTGHVSLAVGHIIGAAPTVSPNFTGNPTAPTPAPGDSDTSIATTAFVTNAVVSATTGGPDTAAIEALTGTGILTRIGVDTWFLDTTLYAPLASPTFTGAPKAPTPLVSSNDTSLATTAFVSSKVAQSGSTGEVIYYAADTAPFGFLIADGSAISRTTFAALFGVIGTTYGVGDGSTTFNIPDLRGVFPRGLDRNKGYDVDRTIGSYQADDFKSHTHYITTSGNDTVSTGGVLVNHWASGQTGAAGGTETRPKNIALLACIKY